VRLFVDNASHRRRKNDAEAVAVENRRAYLFDRFDKPLMRIVFIGTGENRRADVARAPKIEYDL